MNDDGLRTELGLDGLCVEGEREVEEIRFEGTVFYDG